MILLRPWWLSALLPVAALALWVWRRQRAGGWEAIVSAPVLARMRSLGFVSAGGRRLPVFLPFLGCAIVVFGLSGPATMRTGGEAFARMDPLILMLDMSPSVAQSGRLADAQAAAAQVLQNAGGRPVGVMLFAADAYVASAPTSDAASLQSLIAVLGRDTMPVAGSRPDIALGAARDLFGATPMDLILISDGGGTGVRATEEAIRLREGGSRLWTFALTADGPTPVDANAVQALAEAGGGTAAPIRTLLTRIEAARTGQLARSTEAPLIFDDLGRWLLLLALLPALALIRRQI